MNETINKQTSVVLLPHYQGVDNSVSVGDVTEIIETPREPVEDVSTGDTVDVSDGDVTSGDISAGDISSGDVTSGDISAGDIVGSTDGQDTYICMCTFKEEPTLWESDVTTYGITDGLLLLILCVLLFAVFTRKDY